MRRIRRTPPDDAAEMVASSIVCSRLDHCNSPCAGMSETDFAELQRVRNILACVATGHKRSDDITPVPADLHWLLIKFRVTFKIASLTYSIRISRQPAYLRTMIAERKPTCDRRSSSHDVISKIATKSKSRLMRRSVDLEQSATDNETL